MSAYRGILAPEVLAATAYAAVPHRAAIRLDANEAPVGPPPAVLDRIARALAAIELNRYPEPGAGRLREALARRLGVAADQLVLGVGSDELIQTLLVATRGVGGGVLVPAPTFPMYRLTGRALGHVVTEVPLGSALQLERPAMLEALARHRPAIVFLASPNNPTGACFADADIEALLDAAPGLVVVDEAYGEFAGRSLIPGLSRHPRLVVLRTFSKVGLAALRLGYAVARPELIAELDKVRLPYNTPATTQAAALAVLEDAAFLGEQACRIVAERNRLAARLAEEPRILEVHPSDANFLFCRVRDPRAVHAGLAARGVLVRLVAPDVPPGFPGGLRITVGTSAEHDRLLAALREVPC